MLTDKDIALMNEGHSRLLPAFLAGVVITFNLPTELKDFIALTTTKDLDLPELYPLRLGLELCTKMFLGDVSSWLDPDLVALNPQLSPWFAASGASTHLQLLIVGASSPHRCH